MNKPIYMTSREILQKMDAKILAEKFILDILTISLEEGSFNYQPVEVFDRELAFVPEEKKEKKSISSLISQIQHHILETKEIFEENDPELMPEIVLDEFEKELKVMVPIVTSINPIYFRKRFSYIFDFVYSEN